MHVFSTVNFTRLLNVGISGQCFLDEASQLLLVRRVSLDGFHN
jgi:hypothetical protein